MSRATEAFLAAHGVQMSADELAREMESAVLEREARLKLAPCAELTSGQARNLEAGGLDLADLRDGEVLQADLTSANYAALIRTSLGTSQLAAQLGRKPARMRQRIQEGSLYAFKVAGDWRIPAFQLLDDSLLPGLSQVVARHRRSLHPLAVESWFLTPNPDLGLGPDETPIAPRDWLIAGGDPQRAAELAEQL